MIDRTSRWPEVVPLSSITAVVCAQALLSSWISRFGVPSVITTDRGAQFTSSVWSEVCSILGIRRSQTTSYHPQSNGLIERFHRSLKTSLRARLAGPDWIRHLPLVLLGLRSVPKDDTGMSVAEAVYSTPLTLPGDFLDSAEFPPKVFLQRVEKALAGFS
jgi:transposase InsO family protein